MLSDNIYFPNSGDRDLSYEAMLERYKKANVFAIATSNRICFDSIRDVLFLIEQNKTLLRDSDDYGRVTLENELLKEQVTHLQKELADAKSQILSIVCAYSD